MRIAIGSDHGGFQAKAEIIRFLQQEQHAVDDFGTHSAESCDYPDIAHKVAEAVAAGTYDCGILICGTGIGVSIAANKVPGIGGDFVQRYLFSPRPAPTTTACSAWEHGIGSRPDGGHVVLTSPGSRRWRGHRQGG